MGGGDDILPRAVGIGSGGGQLPGRDGRNHGLHAHHAALAGELIPGFIDGFPQRSVVERLRRGDLNLAAGDVHVDIGNSGQLADLGGNRTGAVVAGHTRD